MSSNETINRDQGSGIRDQDVTDFVSPGSADPRSRIPGPGVSENTDPRSPVPGPDIAISVNNLTKVYKLYDSPADRLKEALNPLRKKYHRDFYALNDVSFEIRKGETVGIIGRNGAGKSTLLKIITGVIAPTGGNVQVNGRVSALLELGAGFNPDLTGLENVYFNGTLLGFSKEDMDNKIDSILAFADIGEFIHQPVKVYSSGMFIRLAFAVAVHIEPEILIVDEALSVGDAAFQQKCFNRIKDFLAKGITVIMVSHAMESILRYCDRGIVLNSGRIVADTTAKNAVDVYKKILANISIDPSAESSLTGLGISIDESIEYKSRFTINPNCVIYGGNGAEIADFAIFDETMVPTNTLYNGDLYHIYMKIKFNEDVQEPIFAFTIRDLKGMEITGTNTIISHIPTGPRKKCEVVTIKFSQMMNLKSGPYSLCLGCTEYVGDELEVHHRLYDILIIHVASMKNMVGIFDPISEISISVGA